jgi:spermidine/putrescine-binding protein
MCIPTTNQHKKEAELFINFLLDPEVSAQNTEYIGYSTPNKKALELLPDEVKNDLVAYPKDEVLSKCETFKDLGDSLKLYDNAWRELKSK